jgi:ribosome-associated protein
MPARRKPTRRKARPTSPVKKATPKKPAKPKARIRRLPAASNRAKVLAPPSLGIASTRETVQTLSDADALELARACRDAASAKKAEGVLMLDIREKAGFADFFVLATGRSVIQARSVADAVVEAGEDKWGAPLRTEGYNDGTWILVDYGAVIVHVFTPQAREFYNLERLWGKAPAPSKRKP